jgi:predicted porin
MSESTQSPIWITPLIAAVLMLASPSFAADTSPIVPAESEAMPIAAADETETEGGSRRSEVMESLGVEDTDLTAGEEAEIEDVDRESAEEGVSAEAADPPDVELEFYGSARLRVEAAGGEVRIRDNRSRVGLAGAKFVTDNFELFTRVEVGVDIGGTVDEQFIPKDGTPNGDDTNLFSRIGLIGFGTKYGAVSFGKQWSVYYDVSSYTDRFAVFGGSASGTYNAGTDGGGSGTGRADGAGKYRLRREAVTFGAQVQNQAEIPLTGGIDYDVGYGLSLTREWPFGLEAGGAYNRATIDNLTADLRAFGLTGDTEAAVAGLKYSQGPLYLATTFSWQKNLEATDQDLFIDATGWEFYGRYNIKERWRVVGGTNTLDPDRSDPDVGQFDIRSAIFGTQFLYGDIRNGDVVYFEAQIQNGHNFNGSRRDNVYTVGFRYSVRY